MIVRKTSIPDVVVVTPKVFEDHRGAFFESFNDQAFAEALGIAVEFVQDNQSHSRSGVLRGLHYQVVKPQGKLIRVLRGEIFDVVVDLRRSSPTFGKWVAETLSAEDRKQLWVPVGFAHGFYVTSEEADVLYKTTEYYSPEGERTIRWNDEELGIEGIGFSGCRNVCMTDVLIIGRNGQIGHEVCEILGTRYDVMALASTDLDLTDRTAIRDVIDDIRPRLTINAAAYTAVDRAEEEESDAMAVNGKAPGVIARQLQATGGALIHFSTDFVFDGSQSKPYSELDTPRPINAYGRTKLAGEVAIRSTEVPFLIAVGIFCSPCPDYCESGTPCLLSMTRPGLRPGAGRSLRPWPVFCRQSPGS